MANIPYSKVLKGALTDARMKAGRVPGSTSSGKERRGDESHGGLAPNASAGCSPSSMEVDAREGRAVQSKGAGAEQASKGAGEDAVTSKRRSRPSLRVREAIEAKTEQAPGDVSHAKWRLGAEQANGLAPLLAASRQTCLQAS